MNLINNNLIIIKYLIYLIPLALLTGPFLPDLFLSLSAILLIIYSVYNKIFIKVFFYKKIIYLYFLYFLLILSSLFSDYLLHSISSSLPFIRIILFLAVVKYVYNNNKNFILNFLPFLFIPIMIVCISGYYQIFYSEFLTTSFQISGLFGEEKIMGSYLSRISPILFAIFFFKKDYYNKLSKKIFFLFIFSLIFILIILSGERTSTINFSILSILIIIFNIGNARKTLSLFIIIFGSLIILFSNIYDYKFRIIDTTLEFSGINQNKIFFFSDHHHLHMLTALSIFNENILLGSGPKTFRIKCKETQHFQDKFSLFDDKKLKKFSKDDNYRLNSLNGCSTHPHHIYLQLLSETGLIITILFIFFVLFFINKVVNLNKNDDKYYFKFVLLLLILINFSPLIPSGNIFNNYFSIMLIFPVALLFASDSKQD